MFSCLYMHLGTSTNNRLLWEPFVSYLEPGFPTLLLQEALGFRQWALGFRVASFSHLVLPPSFYCFLIVYSAATFICLFAFSSISTLFTPQFPSTSSILLNYTIILPFAIGIAIDVKNILMSNIIYVFKLFFSTSER